MGSPNGSRSPQSTVWEGDGLGPNPPGRPWVSYIAVGTLEANSSPPTRLPEVRLRQCMETRAPVGHGHLYSLLSLLGWYCPTPGRHLETL